MLGTDTIDESPVEAGECRCRGRIKLRTTHRDLPGSRRTMSQPKRMRPNPTRFIKTSHDEFPASAGQTFTDTIRGIIAFGASISSRMRKKSTSGVLASFSGSTYDTSTIRRFTRCGLAGWPFCASGRLS